MKGRRKVVFLRGVEGLSGVGLDVRELCVPASVWVGEVRRRKRRKANEDVDGRTHGRRAFGVREPLPRRAGEEAERVRLPRLLREATTFLLMDECAKTEGLFRVNAKAVLVEALRDMYEKGQQFVVWKEKETVLCSAYWREGFGDVGVEEVEAKDGFDVHAAAGLVKMWYGELREPMFPQTCYQALQKFYGGDEVRLEPEQLVAMVREDAEWTILSTTARRILRMHLLPLLSRIVEFGEWNRMTASSLAVCFAPALLRGPDIEEDVKVMVIVRRLLEAMIANWKDHLAPAFDLDYKSFEDELRPPKAIADREDPLEEAGDGILSKDAQRTGITLLDNDASASDTQDDGNDGDEPPPLPVRSNAFPLREGGPPPLPPRPRTFSVPADERPSLPPRIRSSTVADVPQVSPRSSPSSSPTTDCDGKVKRKPAPTVQPLPRYSMVVGPLGQQPGTLEHIPFYNTVEVTADESSDLEQDPDPDLPGYEAMPGSPSRRTIPRKPVPMQGEKEAH
ncbi:MAG: hypothetical protein L6R39_003599 [Caloplaca ligustica]|nr:MAG: hypothetical protein L6R39_003599 [Caloplaca ligustica]